MPNVDSEKINTGTCKYKYTLLYYIIKYKNCGYYIIL